MTYCCEKCFENSEIKDIIRGKKKIGNCSFCKSKQVYVCDLEEEDYVVHALQEGFTRIIEAYTPVEEIEDRFPVERGDLLRNILARTKNLFLLDASEIYRFLIALLPEKYAETPEIFKTPVGIAESVDEDFLAKYSILGNYKWEDFVKEIKQKNRFHSQIINEEVLGKFLLANGDAVFENNIELYRARIWDKDQGFEPDQMFAPPAESARAGRANPEGISMLYLADSLETALREVRASFHDCITVGTFQLKSADPVKIIDLSAIDRGNPFSADDYIQLVVNLPHLEKIEAEISKPMRRTDSALNYLPTQYICDYIKFSGAAGIKYKSTMNETGVNYAFFDENLFECIKVENYKVKIKEYDHLKIN